MYLSNAENDNNNSTDLLFNDNFYLGLRAYVDLQ